MADTVSGTVIMMDAKTAKKLMIAILFEHMSPHHGEWPNCQEDLCKAGVELEKALALAGVWKFKGTEAISP